MAGCLDLASGDIPTTSTTDNDHELTVALDGDGPGEAVQVALTTNAFDLDHDLDPGSEVAEEREVGEEHLDFEVEYGDEAFELEIAWAGDVLEVELEIEQETWAHTEASLGFAADDETVAAAADVEVRAPGIETTLAATDERETDAWSYDVNLEVEDGDDGAELGFEVERDD